jgi:cytochrome c biogenesis protein CcmG/thiol:disulfide interchange protein DsbE
MQQLTRYLALLLLLPLAHTLSAQPDLPSSLLKTLRGATVSFASLTKTDSMILVCFWACTSDASIDELNAINANYEKWKSDLHFKLMAVSVDEGKNANRVRPTVNLNGWTFDVYTDINGDLQKALNSNNLPQSMIIKKGKVLYLQSGYQRGSENYLLQKLREFSVQGR